jgi:mannitol-1-phosphate 5-dehydrogenase
MVEDKLPADALPYGRSHVGFVDTVIGRMVPIPTPEMRAQDVSFIRVEPYKELPVDRSGFAGPVPVVAAMTAEANFPVFTARKLYLHNCGHALLSYLGYLRGHEYGFQALADPLVKTGLERGLAESLDGIVHQYGADRAWLEAHVADLVRRFANRALGDTVFRLGRDPVRKLDPSDRLIGAARAAEGTGELPRYLALGIAAAFCFDPPEDPVSVELQKRIKKEGMAQVLATLCGVRNDEPLGRQILGDVAGLKADAGGYLRATLAG